MGFRSRSRRRALRSAPVPPQQEALKLGTWDRPRDQEALRLVAPELRQPVPLRLVLDALGDDGQAEVVRQVDRAADDGRVAGSVIIAATNDRSILSSSTGSRARRASDE